jgi:hypothetical protein
MPAPEFVFQPVTSAPVHSEPKYTDLEWEVIDHLRQLTDSLVRGELGFEWFSWQAKKELARVGW